MTPGICRCCGCTDDMGCGATDTWVEPDLCSYCQDDIEDGIPLRPPKRTAHVGMSDPDFAAAQERIREARSPEWVALEAVARELAERRGIDGFTSEDVVDRVGREHVHPNTIGAVLGSLCAAGDLVTDPLKRSKARHRAAKGRWINRFYARAANVHR